MTPLPITRMRFAIRTVEKRCEISSDILPSVMFDELLEDFIFGSGVQRRRRFVENQ